MASARLRTPLDANQIISPVGPAPLIYLQVSVSVCECVCACVHASPHGYQGPTVILVVKTCTPPLSKHPRGSVTAPRFIPLLSDSTFKTSDMSRSAFPCPLQATRSEVEQTWGNSDCSGGVFCVSLRIPRCRSQNKTPGCFCP